MSLVKFGNDSLPVFSNLMESFFGRDTMDYPTWPFQGNSLPAVNVQERDDHFLVEVAAPGLKKEDFRITLDNNLLTIASEKEVTHEENKGSYTRREFSYQSFRRSFAVPNSVNADQIEAKYQDGVLHIHIPKKEEAKRKPAKTIDIV